MLRSRIYSLSLAIAALFALDAVNASAAHFIPESTDRPVVGELKLGTNGGLPVLTDEPNAADLFAEADSEFDHELASADGVNFHFASSNSLRRIDLTRNQHVTLSGAPGETVTLSLRDFVLGKQSMVTLEGTATTSFIINVRKQFSLTGSSKVVLSGGVQWDNVIFQIAGRGPAVRLTKRTSLEGIIAARRRSVLLSGHATVFGEVRARRVGIRNAARIIQPPILSP